jgi:signal transduction histidine kinase
MTESMNFKISSALKNIIGKDLITNKYIAVFELVKNSYDSGATYVKIKFENTNDFSKTVIVISDDGCGMNREDIINKWLFVAYSEKKLPNLEDRKRSKRVYAGAKGVGRFSCDRLGSKLILTTKKNEEDTTHTVFINWNAFEENDSDEFVEIPVEYSTDILFERDSGTDIRIEGVREVWDRSSLFELQKSLKKLINPDTEDASDKFIIEMEVPDEKAQDSDEKRINGIIKNDVLEKLDIKTTNISVFVSEDGKEIQTRITDRGTMIFTFKEKNREYQLLKNIHISLFFLNTSAKTNFTRIMGIRPRDYGSVFIYKNGFRVYPYGEPERDFFGIDRRKQQGTKRYFGTREVMGRISIIGENSDFIETTSRDGGFIRTNASDLLVEFFLKKALVILERYVVNVIDWGNPIEGVEITPENVTDKIVSEFTSITKNSDIISIEYNPELIKKTEEFSKTTLTGMAEKLEQVAKSTDNESVVDLAEKVKTKAQEIAERNASLRIENKKVSNENLKLKSSKDLLDRQVLFLKGSSNQNVENLISGMHSVATLSQAIVVESKQIIKGFSEFDISKKQKEKLANIMTTAIRINMLAKLAYNGDQNLKKGKHDIRGFIEGYINIGLARKDEMEYDLIPSVNNPIFCEFDTSAVGVIFDNVISNSIKASADKMMITIKETDTQVYIHFNDNGLGLSGNADSSQIFDYGYSTGKDGTGVGLYHIKKLATGMRGNVSFNSEVKEGFELILELKK